MEREETTENGRDDLIHDKMRRARRRVQRNNIEFMKFGQISWGAPTVHAMGYEHGGLSDLYTEEYIKEERRLKQVQENTFNKKRLLSAEKNINEVQKLIDSYQDALKQLRSPAQIDEARMALAKKVFEEKNRNNPPPKQETSFFGRIMGSHHDTITPAPMTVQETAEVTKWNLMQSQVQEQEHKLVVLNNVRSSLLKTLKAGVSRARKMLMERELSVLKLSKRRDFAMSMALTALVYGFTFHLQQIVDNPDAMEELASVGFLAYFENLLSAADLPGAAHDRSFTQDQVCAIEALQLVAFQIVRESDVLESVEEVGTSVKKRRDTLRALRTRDQDRKSVDRQKSQLSEMISNELTPMPPPQASPPETPDIIGLNSIPEHTDEDSSVASPVVENKFVSKTVGKLDSDSTKPLLPHKPSMEEDSDSEEEDNFDSSKKSHQRLDSVEAEVAAMIEEAAMSPSEKTNDDDDDDVEGDDKGLSSNTSVPSSHRVPKPPEHNNEALGGMQPCDSEENLRNEISDADYKRSLAKLTPPTSLHHNSRFEFPDPKGDALYTEHELHPYHKRIFWDHGEDVRVMRDSVQVRLRLRKSSKYTEGITQNAYIDPMAIRQKRKSSYGTAKKFAGLEQYDSSFGYDLNLPMNSDDLQNHNKGKTPGNSSNMDTHFSGWIEKMGQKQGLLGGSRYKKRYVVLLNGTLTWYTTDEMTRRKGRLHIEAYRLKEWKAKDVDAALEASFGSKELIKFVHYDGKNFNFELQRSSEGGNLTGVRSVKDVVSVEQNEELFEGQLREKLTMRTDDMNVAHDILKAIQRAIKKYKDRSSNYCIRFAGLQLMRPPTNMGTEEVRISTRHETLALEPMRQLVLKVIVPNELYSRLSPSLKLKNKLIRARPILFTQGISSNLISATQRSLQGTSMLNHRNSINGRRFCAF